jgi:hypothetical protein
MVTAREYRRNACVQVENKSAPRMSLVPLLIGRVPEFH